MSRPSITGQRALDVPATPTSPVPTAWLERGNQVLTQAPLRTEKATAGVLGVAGAGTDAQFPLFVQYFQQVYGIPVNAVRRVTSFEGLREELSRYDHIGHLILITHSLEGVLEIDSQQKTCSQFAKEFKGKVPPISEISFDGCVLGGDPAGLRTIAIALQCPRVHASTWFRVLDWWRLVPTGDNLDDSVALLRPAAERASPYLPKSPDGTLTYDVQEQEKLLRASTLALAAEYFIERPDREMPGFVAAVLASTPDANVYRTRQSAGTRLVDSVGAQSALETIMQSHTRPFLRVSVTPWS